ncbi:MAG: Holliday junction branch migration protein RuvA [Microcystis sp.]|jgi:Holliday junction DNA helicase RuvA|uniref:Holliday junction branch migration protein RuvA n=1 Tax=Microcystis TaxID=1125 RepID=UPI000E3AC776|nr:MULTISPECIES: Holliday junction branch migration protein RuvA [Microcystis]NCQ90961.1 Holliday junction branch migration protein RuvA [Microcystis aeruginosa LG13-13]NCR04168.1 Holliday junction branch migration protein RuvA [Microcystis aeruginosa LG13-03]NCR62371.1 Holliday junction branch migration protein RuvA [Microcystis aeruginosa LG11-05]NCR72248.1 Holliday junction branch migration protein RuvA [Microcystis aeruginosa LG13-12]REJ51988.1 MAG: Holliday junction branch migration prote
MINYLRGQAIEVIKTPNNRLILILDVNQIGYEIQIPSRLALDIGKDNNDSRQIFTHLILREEQPLLYGFGTASERDLFRQLLSVNGVGAQLALALIDTLGIEELVVAIVTGNTKILSKTPGVGLKTAERIALELKTKLAAWRQLKEVTATTTAILPAAEIREDVQMTLLALGYSQEEIDRAIAVLSQDALFSKNTQPEDWIKGAINWLG